MVRTCKHRPRQTSRDQRHDCRVGQKLHTELAAITLSNLDRFSKFVHIIYTRHFFKFQTIKYKVYIRTVKSEGLTSTLFVLRASSEAARTQTPSRTGDVIAGDVIAAAAAGA